MHLLSHKFLVTVHSVSFLLFFCSTLLSAVKTLAVPLAWLSCAKAATLQHASLQRTVMCSGLNLVNLTASHVCVFFLS